MFVFYYILIWYTMYMYSDSVGAVKVLIVQVKWIVSFDIHQLILHSSPYSTFNKNY